MSGVDDLNSPPHNLWVHLDLTRDCTADGILAALLDLGLPAEVVTDAFDAVGLRRLRPHIVSHRIGLGQTQLSWIHAFDEGGTAAQQASLTHGAQKKSSRWRRRPSPLMWKANRKERDRMSLVLDLDAQGDDPAQAHQMGTPEKKEKKKPPPHWEDVLMAGGPLTTEEARKALSTDNLPVVTSALAQAALRAWMAPWQVATEQVGQPPRLPPQMLLMAYGRAIAFGAILEALSPRGLLTSALPLPDLGPAESPQAEEAGSPEIWIRRLLRGLPIQRTPSGQAAVNPMGVAFIKAAAGQVGQSQSGRVVRMGVGASAEKNRPRSQRVMASALEVAQAPSPSQVGQWCTRLRIQAMVAPGLDPISLQNSVEDAEGQLLQLQPAAPLGHQGASAGWLDAHFPTHGESDAEKALMVPGVVGPLIRSTMEVKALDIRQIALPLGKVGNHQVLQAKETWVDGRCVALWLDPADLGKWAEGQGETLEMARQRAEEAWTVWRAALTVVPPPGKEKAGGES